jgi:hypothetical protein
MDRRNPLADCEHWAIANFDNPSGKEPPVVQPNCGSDRQHVKRREHNRDEKHDHRDSRARWATHNQIIAERATKGQQRRFQRVSSRAELLISPVAKRFLDSTRE